MMSKSAHERRNRLQRERRTKQGEQPSFRNDALQLFGDGDALAQGTSESAHERRNRLQRKRRAKQRESTKGTSESAHETQNRLRREHRAKQREHPSFRNDALQLFGNEDASAPGRWDCGEMDTNVDSAVQKCGSKNDRQSRPTTTHNFICVARMAKFYCRIFLQHHKSWKFF